jgi:hypothetical protein
MMMMLLVWPDAPGRGDGTIDVVCGGGVSGVGSLRSRRSSLDRRRSRGRVGQKRFCRRREGCARQ